MDLKKRVAALKTDIPAVFLALKAKEIPLIAKIVAGIIVAYALSPIDLIPDFIPILGYLDDVILLPTLVSLTLKLIPPDVFANYREQAKGMWVDGRPKKWYYAIPIILVWALIVFLAVKAILF